MAKHLRQFTHAIHGYGTLGHVRLKMVQVAVLVSKFHLSLYQISKFEMTLYLSKFQDWRIKISDPCIAYQNFKTGHIAYQNLPLTGP